MVSVDHSSNYPPPSHLPDNESLDEFNEVRKGTRARRAPVWMKDYVATTLSNVSPYNWSLCEHVICVVLVLSSSDFLYELEALNIFMVIYFWKFVDRARPSSISPHLSPPSTHAVAERHSTSLRHPSTTFIARSCLPYKQRCRRQHTHSKLLSYHALIPREAACDYQPLVVSVRSRHRRQIDRSNRRRRYLYLGKQHSHTPRAGSLSWPSILPSTHPAWTYLPPSDHNHDKALEKALLQRNLEKKLILPTTPFAVEPLFKVVPEGGPTIQAVHVDQTAATSEPNTSETTPDVTPILEQSAEGAT
ncbi:pre-mRNA-splicing factor CWC2 [Striga asiatica]|uniref:Pre-mRNA-splicing factor CWC2 n=1 Tax=Striga asiatica TaxID=4170 RepID=A0A5A7P0T0_STRAF|nr:pre-mRNA-splicing factor CWC2 [Striga asiatica]